MAIQDDFIGNLRESRRGISGGLNGLRQAPQASSGELSNVGSVVSDMFGPRKVPLSAWIPREIDKPNLEEQNRVITDRYNKGPMSINGMRFFAPTDAQRDIIENSKMGTFQARKLPQTSQEWDDFENNVGSFKDMLKTYSNEPNQSKRIDLLKKSAETYASVPRLLGYLNVMYADEDANQNGRYNDFDYRQVQKNVEDAIQGILNYRYHRS